jgi:GMP synthase (glutamine-hydrolysing)
LRGTIESAEEDGAKGGAGKAAHGDAGVTQVWMSHGDKVTKIADGFKVIATSANSEYAAVSDEARKLFGVQYHPEVRMRF